MHTSQPQLPQQDSATINSTELFKGQRVLVIHHNNRQYTLRITKQNKLILNG